MATIDFNDPAVRAVLVENQKHILRIRNEAKRSVDAEERGPSGPPVIHTLTEFLAQPDEPTPWRIEDLQSKESRVMLAAQFKAGKTTLVTNLVKSLADGELFLGRHKVVPPEGRIGVLDFEMGTSQLKSWYRDQQITNTERVVLFPMRGHAASFDLANPAIRATWAANLQEQGIKYLIVDCLRPILDAVGLDEHHEVGAFLVPFDEMLATAGIPDALVVHHMGHSGERSRGDSRLRDWPDIEWRLVRKDDDPSSPRFITAYGRDVDVPEQELGYDVETRRMTVVGGSRHDAEVDEALSAVKAFIAAAKAEPGRNTILKGLVADGGFPKRVVIAAIKAGVTRGDIVTKPGPRGSHLHSIVTTAVTEEQPTWTL